MDIDNENIAADENSDAEDSDAEDDTLKKVKKAKPKYDFFCENMKLTNLVTSNELKQLIRLKVLHLNQYTFVMYILFSLVIRELLDRDTLYTKTFEFDIVTIQRCISIILGKTLRKSDWESKCIDFFFIKYKYLFDLIDLPNIKSYNQPIEKFSEQILVNINNYYTMNFGRFQFKYLKQMIKFELAAVYGIEFQMPFKLLNLLVKKCQYAINKGNSLDFEIDSTKPDVIKISKQYDITKLKPTLDNFVRREQIILPIDLQGINVNSYNENISAFSKNMIIKNLWAAIQYFHKMIRILETSGQKAFDLLPVQNLGMSHIRLGSRFLSTIYNEHFNESINIKDFESNYEAYYKIMFNLEYFKKRKDLKGMIPVTIITDGISVSCMFRTLKKPKCAVLNTKKMIDLEENKVVKGLYDADYAKCSENYLDKFHKQASDPNIKVMFHTTSEIGRDETISTKSYYHDSHINRNKKKMEKIICESDCKSVYEQLAGETHKTASLEKYLGYVTIIFKNWNTLWSFNGELKAASLKYDTKINKSRAVKKIVRKMTRRRQNQRHRSKEKKLRYRQRRKKKKKELKEAKELEDVEKNVKLKHPADKYFSKSKYEEVKNLPIMLAIGKGNGDMTISNLKNSGPKGPIKTIVKMLSLMILIILVDEYKTSQLCSKCETKLTHPRTQHYKKKNKKTGELDTKGYIKESYRMCYCPNNNCHKIWNRDGNSSKGIYKVLIRKLLGQDLGGFKR
jgi:hypothetical protein